MVTKVNGLTQQGVWFSKDVAFGTLTVTGGDFVDDLAGTNGVDNNLDAVVELLEQYGTVIGLSVTTAAPTVLHFIVDYANSLVPDANDPLGQGVANTVQADLITAIDGLAGFSGAAFSNVGTNFAAAAA